jgi:hypothetical protein
MALSRSDKEEIAAMFEALSERMTTGRFIQSPEEKVLDLIVQAVRPQIVPLGQRLEASPGIQRPGDILVSEAITTALVPSKRKKAMTKFNRSVKEGMKIVKASKSYGKAKTINSPKKAFAAVTRTVSKVLRGKPKPKTGVLKKVAAAAAKILKPKSKPKGRSRAQDFAAYQRSKRGKTR